MDGRFARTASRLIAGAAASAAIGLACASPVDAARWRDCPDRDDACDHYLNVTLSQGDAHLAVDAMCRSAWEHVWRRADARRTVRQWLGARAATGSGRLCIRLSRRVDEIRITSLGGRCGSVDGEPDPPAAGATLARGPRGVARATLTGCHGSIGEVGFGGVAIDFADGYRFADSYATGHFYGLYDGFGPGGVRPLGAPAVELARFNTYHYRVELLAGGAAWRKTPKEDER